MHLSKATGHRSRKRQPVGGSSSCGGLPGIPVNFLDIDNLDSYSLKRNGEIIEEITSPWQVGISDTLTYTDNYNYCSNQPIDFKRNYLCSK